MVPHTVRDSSALVFCEFKQVSSASKSEQPDVTKVHEFRNAEGRKPAAYKY